MEQVFSFYILHQVKFLKTKQNKTNKKKKTVVEQGRKHIDAIINKNKRLAALANKLDHKGYKSIFQELVIETFYEMK